MAWADRLVGLQFGWFIPDQCGERIRKISRRWESDITVVCFKEISVEQN